MISRGLASCAVAHVHFSVPLQVLFVFQIIVIQQPAAFVHSHHTIAQQKSTTLTANNDDGFAKLMLHPTFSSGEPRRQYLDQTCNVNQCQGNVYMGARRLLHPLCGGCHDDGGGGGTPPTLEPPTTPTPAPTCPSGYYCPSSPSSPVQCPAGSYCPSGATAATPCSAGTYCIAGASGPTTCPAGSYCGAQAGAPTSCTAGTYCPAGAPSPTTCPAGSYCGAQAGAPTSCTAGTYCPAGASGPTTCPAGSYCSALSGSATTCPAGSYCGAGAGTHTPCSAGTYCPSGSSAASACPAGSYCPASASSPTVCPVGHYCGSGSSAPVKCRSVGYCPRVGMAAPSYSMSVATSSTSTVSQTTLASVSLTTSYSAVLSAASMPTTMSQSVVVSDSPSVSYPGSTSTSGSPSKFTSSPTGSLLLSSSTSGNVSSSQLVSRISSSATASSFSCGVSSTKSILPSSSISGAYWSQSESMNVTSSDPQAMQSHSLSAGMSATATHEVSLSAASVTMRTLTPSVSRCAGDLNCVLTHVDDAALNGFSPHPVVAVHPSSSYAAGAVHRVVAQPVVRATFMRDSATTLMTAVACDCHVDAIEASVTHGGGSGAPRRLRVVHLPNVSSVSGATALLLSTTDGPWLQQLGVSAFRTVTLRVSLRLSGGSGQRHEMEIAVDVLPAPLPPVTVAVGAVVAGGQFASFVAPPATASALGRVVASRALALCSGDGASSGGGLLQLSVGSGSSADDVGAVVGNVLLVCAVGAVLCCVAAAYAARCCCGLGRAVGRVALPSVLLQPWLATVPTSVVAVARLCAAGEKATGAATIVAAAVGVAWVVVPVLLLARLPSYVLVSLRLELRAKGVDRKDTCEAPAADAPLWCRLWERVVSFVVASRRREARWQATTATCDRGAVSADGLTAVLDEHRALWYPPADSSALLGASVLAAVTGVVSSAVVCRGAAVVLLALYAAQLAAVVLWRPFTTKLAQATALTLQALLVCGCAFQTVFVFGAGGGSGGEPPGTWPLVVSGACDVMLLSVAMLRMVVVDVPQLVKACVVVFYEMRRCSSAESDDQCYGKGGQTDSVRCMNAQKSVCVMEESTASTFEDGHHLDCAVVLDSIGDSAHDYPLESVRNNEDSDPVKCSAVNELLFLAIDVQSSGDDDPYDDLRRQYESLAEYRV